MCMFGAKRQIAPSVSLVLLCREVTMWLRREKHKPTSKTYTFEYVSENVSCEMIETHSLVFYHNNLGHLNLCPASRPGLRHNHCNNSDMRQLYF